VTGLFHEQDTMKIQGARVLVTGAGSGIGRATALQCARQRASVIAVDIDEQSARATAEACTALSATAAAYACDVADYDAVVALADAVEREHGPVDVLVNNAGVGVAGPFLDNSIEDWRWLRGVNLDGVVHGCHTFGARMVARRRGHVVNIASMAGYMPHSTLAGYCTSKSAVIMLSQCLRADWAGAGVGVSAICPGVIDTPIPRHTRLVGAMSGKRDQAIRAFRFGHSPDAVAKAIVKAVENNRETVPVGIESGVAYRVVRFAPPMVRGLLARLQVP
jgi:NAD(P)-dependent dehydrogenase (short-subunit alcohol dehydrogenase family)